MNIPRQCSGELYRYLEVPNTSSDSDIKKSYRKLALKLHPDKTGGQTAEEFKRIGEANAILSDPEQRQLYDKVGRSGISKLGQFGMGSTMGTVVSHPFAVSLLLIIAWFFSVLLLIFLVLVNVNIDSKKGWSWAVVFVPLWIIFVPFLGLAVFVLISGLSARNYKMIFSGLQVLLGIASVCCMVSSLGGHLKWRFTFEVICGVYLLVIIKVILDLRLSKFKEYLTECGFLDPLGVTWRSPVYIKHVASSILKTVFVLVFIILLSFRVVLDGHKNMNFYVIFSPIFFYNFLPIIFMTVELLVCPSLSTDRTTRSKVINTIQLLVQCAIRQYMFVMIAVKCQRELNEGLSGPSASVCTIPLYILFGSMVLMLCCVCTYSVFLSDSDTEIESALNNEENTEYTACTVRQNPPESGYKTATDIDN